MTGHTSHSCSWGELVQSMAEGDEGPTAGPPAEQDQDPAASFCCVAMHHGRKEL